MQKIELLGEDIMKEGKDKKNNIEKPFVKYREAVKRIKFVEWAKEEIQKRSEKVIIVKAADLAKELGPDFEKIKYHTLYQALRYVLFYYGLKIRIGTHKEGDKVFVISEKSPDEKLPDSYIELEKKKEDRLNIKKERKSLIRIKNRKERLKLEKDKIKKEREEIREEFKQEKAKLLEQFEKEKEELHKEMYELKKILDKNFENNVLVEVFKFNWKTLAWKLVKRKGANSYDILFGLIKEYQSSMDNRYRFEVTPIGKESAEENTEIKSDKINEDKKLLGEILDTEKQLLCPRCGKSNITVFPNVEVIKTRSGERKLKYRCNDCNEIFGDDDLK